MQQLITKVSEVTKVLSFMENELIRDLEDCNLPFVQAQIGFIRKKICANNFYSSWQQFFLRIGGIMLKISSKNNMNINHTEFGEFLLGKHQAYGAEPFNDWREVGILMRLGSKIARLINIAEDTDIEVKADSESFQDTFRDIIGYCVLGYYIDRLEK